MAFAKIGISNLCKGQLLQRFFHIRRAIGFAPGISRADIFLDLSVNAGESNCALVPASMRRMKRELRRIFGSSRGCPRNCKRRATVEFATGAMLREGRPKP